jgi:NIPSNAP
LAFAGHSEFGGLNRWCHIWAYKDAAERFAIREKARNEGIWPPKGRGPRGASESSALGAD